MRLQFQIRIVRNAIRIISFLIINKVSGGSLHSY